MADVLLRGTQQQTPHVYVTGTRQTLTNVHDPSACENNHCCIHAPSRHALVNAPTHWRRRTLRLRFISGKSKFVAGDIMERICPCGVFHPDPDDLAFIVKTKGLHVALALADHDCCGCC